MSQHQLRAALPPPLAEEEAEFEDALASNAAMIERSYLDSWIGYDGTLRLPGRFRVYAESELGQFPPVEWFPGLEGMLPRRELVGFYGAGDSYKTFTAVDWSCYLASQAFDVLYIAAEGVTGLQNRIAAWKKHHGVPVLPHLRVVPMPVRIHVSQDVAEFVACVQAQMSRPALVVVDTLARNFVGGNENSAQDLGYFVDGAERIRTVFGCTVVVIHHTTKDGASERGGESLRNASFAMFRFERKSASRVVVACDRMKDAPRPAHVLVEPVVVELEEDASSLVADWPYSGEMFGAADLDVKPESALNAERRFEIRKAIVDVVRERVGPKGAEPRGRMSRNQIVERVNFRNADVGRELKHVAIEQHYPVQVEDDEGKGVLYCYEEPHGDD
jgi:hypothetical protein